MEILKTVAELQAHLKNLQGDTVGLVPTMGALHSGHLALVKQALSDNDVAVCSIFVNPRQFNNASDLQNYPRTVENDLALLKQAGCHVVFLPSESEVYPNGFSQQTYDLGNLDNVMEGAFRPGHFQGVAAVVNRFFDIVQPTRAYFGEKDFQQLAIIRHINKKRFVPVEIVGVPTIRDEKGLALSSRNLRLNNGQKQAAAEIFNALNWAKTQIGQGHPTEVAQKVAEKIDAIPGLKHEYISIANQHTLSPLSDWEDVDNARIFAAVFAGDVRLIDNLPLN